MAEVLNQGDGAKFPTMQEMKERAFALLVDRPYDTLVSYAELEKVMAVAPQKDQRARAAVLAAGRRVLTEHNKKIVNVRRRGYQIIRPNQQAAQSAHERKRGCRVIRTALKTATHVDLSALTTVEVARVMTEQARAAMVLSMSTKLARVELPAREELALPSGSKLVEMMTRRPKS